MVRKFRPFIRVQALLIPLFFFAGFSQIAFGQSDSPLSIKLESDQQTYAYGDTIVVELTLTNESESTYEIQGSSSCIVRLEYGGVDLETVCTTDLRNFIFEAGESRSWRWKLKPPVHGIPVEEGTQTLVGYETYSVDGFENTGENLADTIQVEVEKYKGGTVEVGYEEDITEDDKEELRSEYNAEVVADGENESGEPYERWQVEGHQIDSLEAAFGDERVRYLEVVRELDFNESFYTGSKIVESEVPEGYSLSQNYPNPFNPDTRITYYIPERAPVTLEVYTITGEHVATLVDEPQSRGTHEITFDGSGLSSGTYIYRLQAGEFMESKSMMLVK